MTFKAREAEKPQRKGDLEIDRNRKQKSSKERENTARKISEVYFKLKIIHIVSHKRL